MSGHATRRRLTAVLAVVFVVGAGVAGVAGVVDVASGQADSETLYVDDGFEPADPFCAPDPENTTERYQSIRDAVNDADSGDTIRVCDGTYIDQVRVNETLTIVGAGGEMDGAGSFARAITVGSGGSGTVIEDLPIRGYGSRGVAVEGAGNVRIENVTVEDIDGPAIELRNATGSAVRNVTVRDSDDGVRARSSPDLTVGNVTAEDIDGVGMRLIDVTDAVVRGTEIRNADTGIVAESTPDLQVVGVGADRVDGTAVNITNASGATVRGVDASNGSAGVSVRSSPGVTVRDGRFDDLGGTAVALTNADGALVRDVTVEGGLAGVAVTANESRAMSDVTVRNATVANASDGVRVDVSDGATLSGVTLSDLDLSGNGHGIGVFASGNGPDNLDDVLVEDSTVEDSTTRGVEVSTVNSNPEIEGVTLRNLTVDGPGTGDGVYLSAQGAGLLRNLTLRNSSITSHEVGVTLQSEAVVEDVVVLRNRIEGGRRGIRLDGDGTRPLRGVGVRRNLVANAEDAGVFVTGGTDPRGVRVTRNVVRDNEQGIVNEGDAPLTAWLNYWGADSGPSGGEPDPRTDTAADGDGDSVSSDVRFDPWLGKGACSEAGLRNVTEGSTDLYGASVGLAELRSFCAWDLAPLSLRPNPADAATRVDNLNLSYDLPGTGGPVSANRPEVAIYEQGESFELQFGAGPADASRFAGEDVQLLVVRDSASTNASFDVGFDERAGETVLRSDAESATVRPDWGTLDSDGRLDESFEPDLTGSYTFVLVAPGFGPGVEEVSGRSEIRLDGGATVVGFETVVVRETAANATNTSTNATTANGSYPAGSDVSFELASNLPSRRTDHAVLLYDESRFRNATATVTVDATAADVVAGEVTPADVSVESSVSDLNGFYRGDGGFAGLGVDVASSSTSGRVDPSPFLGLGTRLYDTTAADPADAPGATPLDGSVVVRSDDSDTAVDVETFANFSTGTYRYVYLAGVERGRETSSDSGTIRITTPVATPTPTPGDGGDGGDGGGGGGGQPGAAPGGEVEIQNATLLNGTVEAGQPVVVRVDLANFDPAQGRITLTMTADGEPVTQRTVSVGASTRRTVFVRHAFAETGTYTVGLNGETLGDVTVTAAETPGETPTRSPTAETGPPATATPTDGTGPSTATASPAPGADGTATPASDGTPAIGPPPATGTEAVIALGMTLLLLYGVGVAVYVLREHPPSRLG